MITALKFVGIPVADQERALRFYTEIVGFTVATDQPMSPEPGAQRWIELRIGRSETGIALFTPPGHEPLVGTFLNLSLACDDVERTYAAFIARGATFAKPPKREPWGTSAILIDSEGNSLVLSSR